MDRSVKTAGTVIAGFGPDGNADPAYVAHCANKYVGYLPHARGYDFDGHESNGKYTFWAKMKRGSLERVCDAAVADIERLFGASPAPAGEKREPL